MLNIEGQFRNIPEKLVISVVSFKKTEFTVFWAAKMDIKSSFTNS